MNSLARILAISGTWLWKQLFLDINSKDYKNSTQKPKLPLTIVYEKCLASKALLVCHKNLLEMAFWHGVS